MEYLVYGDLVKSNLAGIDVQKHDYQKNHLNTTFRQSIIVNIFSAISIPSRIA